MVKYIFMYLWLNGVSPISQNLVFLVNIAPSIYRTLGIWKLTNGVIHGEVKSKVKLYLTLMLSLSLEWTWKVSNQEVYWILFVLYSFNGHKAWEVSHVVMNIENLTFLT